MTVYTLAEAESQLAAVLEQAAKEGEICIRGDEGSLFVLKPAQSHSPLDVEGVDVDISKDEIIEVVRASRER